MSSFFQSAPQIIEAAAKSPSGLFALMILVLACIALLFFRHSATPVKLVIFAVLFVGTAGFAVAIFDALADRPRPPATVISSSTPPPASTAPVAQAPTAPPAVTATTAPVPPAAPTAALAPPKPVAVAPTSTATTAPTGATTDYKGEDLLKAPWTIQRRSVASTRADAGALVIQLEPPAPPQEPKNTFVYMLKEFGSHLDVVMKVKATPRKLQSHQIWLDLQLGDQYGAGFTFEIGMMLSANGPIVYAWSGTEQYTSGAKADLSRDVYFKLSRDADTCTAEYSYDGQDWSYVDKWRYWGACPAFDRVLIAGVGDQQPAFDARIYSVQVTTSR